MRFAFNTLYIGVNLTGLLTAPQRMAPTVVSGSEVI